MHAPPGYDCPFCKLARGEDSQRSSQADVVYRDAATTAFVAAKWWANNPGHVLVVPNEHVENLYEIADDVLGAVYATARRVALAMKEAYDCRGVSTRQHNEPAGNQDVWHLHVHVFPRWDGGELYDHHRETHWPPPEVREPYAAKLRAALAGA